MNIVFDTITDINRAYCAAHGMASAELYGTPPNLAELVTHQLIADGVQPGDADPHVTRMKADRLRIRKLVAVIARRIRTQNAGYTCSNFGRMVNRENYMKGQK